MENVLNALVTLTNFALIPGLAYGSQLALGALGVTLVFAVLRFSNFAHGETMSFGAMLAIFVTWLLQSMGVSIDPLPTALLALPFAILGTVLFVLFTDRVIYRFYRDKKSDQVIFIIVSIGVMFVMAGLIRFIIGPSDQNFTDGARFVISAGEFKQLTGLREGLAIKTTQVITLVTAGICVAFLFWFLQKTRTGKSMRAYADNEDLATLSGIDAGRVVLIAWTLSAALATIAGTLYGLDKSYKPFVYQELLLPIFAAAIVGGFGSPVGAIVGGYIIAFAEVLITYAYKRFLGHLLPEDWMPDGLVQLLATEYKFAVAFVILVLTLLLRPYGLFNKRTG
ncbi:branched-chain amino acid ABC transporter permease [Acuticoccus sp. MNP-M23]|uniref:branched-chain amino acid ABC transporter permease n=1 Tax=Acuticoccus sp. MNP-M23 TaxID=3072793 RepID=UPI0028156A36|nr:branched-chain amino acid ABC transporter permease [Acuticoccus sp. MNP-M23]WMS43672.1 branched-chain amino acid ABC transporter permease [Acuticoccus sp. MNP-M23]